MEANCFGGGEGRGLGVGWSLRALPRPTLAGEPRETAVPLPPALGGGGGGTRLRVAGGVGTRRGGPASLSAPVYCTCSSRQRQPPRRGVTQTWLRSPANEPTSPFSTPPPARFVPPAALTGRRLRHTGTGAPFGVSSSGGLANSHFSAGAPSQVFSVGQLCRGRDRGSGRL